MLARDIEIEDQNSSFRTSFKSRIAMQFLREIEEEAEIHKVQKFEQTTETSD